MGHVTENGGSERPIKEAEHIDEVPIDGLAQVLDVRLRLIA